MALHRLLVAFDAGHTWFIFMIRKYGQLLCEGYSKD